MKKKMDKKGWEHIHARGVAASPATIPAIVKQDTVERVGRLPGVLYSTNGASPVILSMASERAYLAFW